MTSTSPPFQNVVLNSLSASDLKLIQPSLESDALPVRHLIETANKPIKRVYFLEDGLASVIATNRSHRLEVGLIGRDGMTGISVVLGQDTSPNETFIQVAGTGHSIPVQALRTAMDRVALLSAPYWPLPTPSSTRLRGQHCRMERQRLRRDWHDGFSWRATNWAATTCHSPMSFFHSCSACVEQG